MAGWFDYKGFKVIDCDEQTVLIETWSGVRMDVNWATYRDLSNAYLETTETYWHKITVVWQGKEYTTYEPDYGGFYSVETLPSYQSLYAPGSDSHHIQGRRS